MASVFRVQYAAPDAAVFHTHRACPVGRAIPGALRVSGSEAAAGRVQCAACEAMSDPRRDAEAFRYRRPSDGRP
jgi:hypothetical protein